MDRDKVIKGIRKCLSHKPCSENGCPYENECAVEHLNDPLLRDALALLKEQQQQIWEIQDQVEYLTDKLKEQEAVKPKVSCTEQRCGHCNKVIEMDGWQSCPWCGKRIDWKGWLKKNGTRNQDS